METRERCRNEAQVYEAVVRLGAGTWEEVAADACPVTQKDRRETALNLEVRKGDSDVVSRARPYGELVEAEEAIDHLSTGIAAYATKRCLAQSIVRVSDLSADTKGSMGSDVALLHRTGYRENVDGADRRAGERKGNRFVRLLRDP